MSRFGHDLHAAGDGARARCVGRRHHLVEHAVDAVAHLELVLERLEVDVGGLVLDGLHEDEVEELDDLVVALRRRAGRRGRWTCRRGLASLARFSSVARWLPGDVGHGLGLGVVLLEDGARSRPASATTASTLKPIRRRMSSTARKLSGLFMAILIFLDRG